MDTRDSAAGRAARTAGDDGAAVTLHPSAPDGANRLIAALADEFDRWMVDDIEEFAETVGPAAPGLKDRADEITHLADHLIGQARTLGHPRVAEIAVRLKSRVCAMAADATGLEEAVAADLGAMRSAASR